MSKESNANVLDQAVADLIQKTIETGSDVANFVQAELPDVVHQLIMFYGIKYTFIAIFWTALILVVHWRMNKFFTAYGDNEEQMSYLTAKWGFTLCAGIVAFIYTIKAIFVWVAPKVFLLEYMRKLL